MIDRNSRDKLALALRRYAAKRITNDELEDAVDHSQDRGIAAIQDMAWRLYSDMFCHRADGPYTLNKGTRRTMARWIIFLRTDYEYSWPDYDFRQPENSLDQFVRDFFTAGHSSKKKRQRWQDFVGAGDFEVWPFLHKRDEESARRRCTR
jgi:hypothetical protein